MLGKTAVISKYPKVERWQLACQQKLRKFDNLRSVCKSLSPRTARPVSASRKHAIIGRLFKADSDAMQPWPRITGLKTQQIAAVQMVCEINHAAFKTTARIEEFKLAARLIGNCLRSVLFHGCARQIQQRHHVHGRAFIFAPQSSFCAFK